MKDDNDDIVIIEEIKPANRKRWHVQNPLVKKGTQNEILDKVRKSLQMNNDITLDEVCSSKNSSPKHDSPSLLKDGTSKSPPQLKTPVKTSPVVPPVALTPEQIQELTENCLNSDNEPESSFDESTTEGFKRPVDSAAGNSPKTIKASSSLRNHTSKYFGAGSSSGDVVEILSQKPGTSSSPSQSPKSAKKKRLSKNSPIRMLPSHKNARKSPKNLSPSFHRPGLKVVSPSSVRRVLLDEMSSVQEQDNGSYDSNGPYYFEAFCFMIKKIFLNENLHHLFLKSELQKIKDFDEPGKEFQLYVRLINRKDKWYRVTDIRYPDIAEDLSPLFDMLQEKQYVSCDTSNLKLEDMINLLKVEELRSLCSTFKSKKSGNKKELIERLLTMHKTQPTFGKVSPLCKSVTKLLGRCVYLTHEWRHVFRRCIILFSMFHSFEDLDKLSSEQALLLLQLKLKNMIFPLSGKQIQTEAKVFLSREQLLRYEEAKLLKQDLHKAVEEKDNSSAEELTNKAKSQFQAVLDLCDETKHVLSLSQFLRRYSAGAVYAATLTHCADAMKRAHKLELAAEVLRLLLKQDTYYTHYRGRWILQLSTLLHVNLKNTVEAALELHSGLSDKSLNAVDRMHLQQRAEKVLKLKKNGLPTDYSSLLRQVLDIPYEPPSTVEIPACAHSSYKRGLKRIYIRDGDDGGKEFMSVEEYVIAHYNNLGFSRGVHDEGSTLCSLCLLALWDHIYDPSIASVFQSPYQSKPLDWGSKLFYDSRKEALENRLSYLESQSLNTVAEELIKYRENFTNVTSVVNWDRLERLNIKELLDCVTLPVFIAVCRRLVQDWKSHRSGFPDLLVWCPSRKKCLFIEVKSPNDVLSTVQCMWLDFLRKSKATAFVAHIKEAGAKQLIPEGVA